MTRDRIHGFGVLLALLLAVLILPLSPVMVRGASGGSVLYEDGPMTGCLQYAAEKAGEGIGGGTALELQPDPWHKPILKLYCAGGGRRDFRPYDVLEFQVRSPHTDPGGPTFSVRTWDRTSRTLSLRAYMEDGLLDGTWRRVRIPLADLMTPDWDLGNVESLVWGTDASRRKLLVDRIVLREETPPALITDGKEGPFPESARILRIAFTKPCEEASVRNPWNFTLTSVMDLAYAAPLHPLATGILQEVTGFTESKAPLIGFRVFLSLPFPLRNGCTYTLSAAGVKDRAGNVMPPSTHEFCVDEDTLETPVIKVNQVGYMPGQPKMGHVGGYLGDLGGGAWAVGRQGALYAWDPGSGWDRVSYPAQGALRAVAAMAEDAVWAVGDRGVILHFNGEEWTQVASPTTKGLFALALGPTGIGWAVGEAGTALRSENDTWQVVPTPVETSLRGVWAGPGDTAWAVGDGGRLLAWSHGEWRLEACPVAADLLAIGGPHQDWLWAVGAGGTVLLRRYGKWTVFGERPESAATLRAVTADPAGRVWIGGDNGILWRKPGFGSSAFEAQQSPTHATLYALARQHHRLLWAVGDTGTLLSNRGGGWQAERGLPPEDAIYGVFALPYGALRLPKPMPSVTIEAATPPYEAVLTIPLVLQAANWFLSGEDVYAFDFSALASPGTYRAHVPGIGVSVPFSIGEEPLLEAAAVMARGLYYQRCGYPLVDPYADEAHERPACHMKDALYHPSLVASPLYGGETPEASKKAAGGWHDAGDYGKYLPTGASAVWALLTAWEMAPESFVDGTSRIPESGNGVPDLLDEARYEISWLLGMQAEDGGIYHKLTTESWFEGMPTEDKAPRYLFEKTTHDTALGAAVFASASRVWKDMDPAFSETCLTRAEQAWGFLTLHPESLPEGGFKNPEGVHTGDYTDTDDADNRLWAAAELYRTTGRALYKAAFESWWRTSDHPWGYNVWQHVYPRAYWAYLRAPWADADPEILGPLRTRFLKEADEALKKTTAGPYWTAARLDVPEWIGWGSFSQSGEYAYPLLMGWTLNPVKTYLDAAYLNLATQLGDNPLALCMVTGLGRRSPEDPLHMVSVSDGVAAPVPGIPVFGVCCHMNQDNPYHAAAQSDENACPYRLDPVDPYPILRRYIDAHQLVPMSEFTIVDMAMAAGVLGILSRPPGSP